MPAVAAIGGTALVGWLSSRSQAKASKQASDVQVQASDKAMAYQQQQQQYAQQYAERMRTMPIQGPPAGGAQSYLSHLMGIPGASSSQGAPPMPPITSSAGYQMNPNMGVPRGAGGPNMGYAGLMGGAPGASGASNGGMVMLEAPTGERQSVPMDQAQGLIARGARRVS